MLFIVRGCVGGLVDGCWGMSGMSGCSQRDGRSGTVVTHWFRLCTVLRVVDLRLRVLGFRA